MQAMEELLAETQTLSAQMHPSPHNWPVQSLPPQPP
jgi:hypothetical protein